MKIQGIQISTEDADTLRQIKWDRQTVRGWHPGDDSPFQRYSGYTVRDARCHMQRIVEDIRSKYGISNAPSPATLARLQAKSDAKHKQKRSIDQRVAQQFPRLKAAMQVLWRYQYARQDRYVKAALKRHGFRTVSEAAAMRAAANRYKKTLR